MGSRLVAPFLGAVVVLGTAWSAQTDDLQSRTDEAAQAVESGQTYIRVQQAGFDLDLTKLYRGSAKNLAPVIHLPANPRQRVAQWFATWDMPLPITPANHDLAAGLITHATAALGMRIALLEEPRMTR